MEKEWFLIKDILMETVEHLQEVSPKRTLTARRHIMTGILKIEQHLAAH